MTWGPAEAARARRVLAREGGDPAKRAITAAKLKEYELNPQNSEPAIGDAAMDASRQAFGEPVAPDRTIEPRERWMVERREEKAAGLQKPSKLPTTAAEIEAGGKREKSQAELDEEALQRRNAYAATHDDSLPNASKLKEFNLPVEYTPPTAGIIDKLSPFAWQEPSRERFLADMGNSLSYSEMAQFEQDPESSRAYRIYRDRSWQKALQRAQGSGQPIVRAAFMPGIWQSLSEPVDEPLHLGANLMQGIRTADSAARGFGSAVSLRGADALDRAVRPEGAAEAEENARANPIANLVGETAGYLSPVGGANAVFSGVKAGVERALPTLGKGAIGALATGAIAAPAIGAIERGFDPNEKALDPDRAVIESLLGAGFGLAGHGLGWLPKKGVDLVERGPRGPTLEAAERLGVRLGPTGGVNLPPAAEALQAERRALPLQGRPDSEVQMVIDRARPKVAEGAYEEASRLRGKQELETGTYNISDEGQARVPVERTLQAARDRIAGLKDASGRPLPGSKPGMSLAEEMEAQLEQFGGTGARSMNAAELDRFLEWVDSQVNFAKRTGASDPLYDDFVRAVREDRQQFGANAVTDRALGLREGAREHLMIPEYQDSASAAEQFLRSHGDIELLQGMTEGSSGVNSYLRRPIGSARRDARSEQRAAGAGRALDDALAAGHAYPGVAYRGVNVPPEVLEQWRSAGTIRDPGFWSASADQAVAQNNALPAHNAYAPAVVLRINTQSGVPIRGISTRAGEQEVLIPPGRNWRILAESTDSEGRTVLDVAEAGRAPARQLPRAAEPTATLGSGDQVTGLAAMKAKQELDIGDLDKRLAVGGLPRNIANAGREPSFTGNPGQVRLDPVRDVEPLNNALRHAYEPNRPSVTLSDGTVVSQRDAVEHFARKWEQLDPENTGLVEDLRAMGATRMGEELRNMGRLFGTTTQSGARYGRMVHAALPWLRALASEGRIPSRVLDFVRNLRAGLGTAPGGTFAGRFRQGFRSPLPGPDELAPADPFGLTSMQGLGLRGGGPAARGRQLVDPAGRELLSEDEPDPAAKTLTEEDVVNLAKLIESTRREPPQ